MKRMSSLLFLLLAASCPALHADDVAAPQSKGTYDYHDAMTLWQASHNAAGLGLDSMVNRGVTWLEASHRHNSHHLVQEGDARNVLGFTSERYQQVGKYLVAHGKFAFEMGRDFNRAWCDELRTRHSVPYTSGSAIAGKYERQFIDLSAQLATRPLGPFTYGFGLDYQVGDYSRLRDPRSRVNLAVYRVVPSLTYSIGRHTLGLAAHYRRYKEKVLGLTTVQTDATLTYYQHTGMEHTVGTVGGYASFSRQYVNHEFGGELTYGWSSDVLRSLTTLGLDHAREYIHEPFKAEPAAWRNQQWRILSQNRLRAGRMLHQLDAAFCYRPALGDEHRQERQISIDPATGISSTRYVTLINYRSRYEVEEYWAQLHYRAMWLDAATRSRAYLGARATWQYDREQYNLPVSFMKVGGLTTLAEGGIEAFRRGERSLWLEAQAGYHFSTQSELSLHDATGLYATSVLIPNMDYYGASYFDSQLALTWQMPVRFKHYRNVWYARLDGSYLTTDKETDAYRVSFAIGIYY